ncbi:F0F1 ATP synthase subunit delta [Clostridium sp. FAM 1755]|uniref:ATP synthase subunit delta n=2 Tax=Clostridium TaxID=1485 RepID=A0A6M0T0J9_CLOBO|nr:F0F1 ATP synthase subunit delta [Clostridium sporogenes]EJP6473461.1 F0F1 ATP synthase subunit delta [Clostridium botulinum]MDS1003146.1 F0F1 ATP synthase subunit delta [Clostridium sporogenes]NFA60685.1 F0F1 ATP synthase subunit delta [Clostridium botulinum]NFI74135.1 F0F1 ATP synthase subunit delta [Clostridium sporogenes]NFL71849.1 F0F1 ATP synthase subunit delta [Clostridium sporogenes]
MYEYLDKRYALALYKVAEEKNKVNEYLKDLKEVVNIIKNSDDIYKILKHPEISTSRKKEIFTEIFKDKIDDGILSFLLILIEKDRILYLEEKLKQMEKIYLEKNNMVLANVKTVIPLLEDERAELIKKLGNKYNKEIILEEEIDKSILGGVYVRVGDDVLDGTLSTRLKDIKKMMLKRE